MSEHATHDYSAALLMSWYEKHILPYVIDFSMRRADLAAYRERNVSAAQPAVVL